ncbi:MAG: hypothetical protein N2442_12950, partial [Spirochaetes bacterium]|nr:hypothetical protein [Spirochaetota bacterium]
MEGLRIALRTRVYPWFMVVLGFLMFYLLSLGPGKVFCQEPDTKEGAIFEQGQVRGQGTNKWQFSIVMESTAQGAWVPGYGSDEKGTFGFEQYGNLRLEAPLNRWGKVYVAGNVLAASGSSLERAVTTSTGQGYGSLVELERLYYRLETESSDWETGLLRIPFGFGQAFRPTDFLNPPNPLNPDARPRGVLGTVYTLYPTDSILFRVYA